MAKLYFIGGEDVKKISEVKIHKKVLSKGQKVLAFLWATNDSESIKKYQKVLTELFYLLCDEKCDFADFNFSTEKIRADKICRCSLSSWWRSKNFD